MAIINVGESNAPVLKVPAGFSDTVTLRVKKYTFGKSNSSGRDQIVLECEIVAPDKSNIDGIDYVIAGQEINFYMGISDEVVGKAKSSSLAQLKEFHQKLGLPMEIDTENLPYEGLCFEYWLTSSEKTLQRKEGNKFVAVIDPTTNKPRTLGCQWNNFLGNVLGPSSFNN